MNGEVWCEELTVAQLEELQPRLHSCWWSVQSMGQRHLAMMMDARVRHGLPAEFQDEPPRDSYRDIVQTNLPRLRRHRRVRIKKTPCHFPPGRDTSSGVYAEKAPGVLEAFKKKTRGVEQDLEARWRFLLGTEKESGGVHRRFLEGP